MRGRVGVKAGRLGFDPPLSAEVVQVGPMKFLTWAYAQSYMMEACPGAEVVRHPDTPGLWLIQKPNGQYLTEGEVCVF